MSARSSRQSKSAVPKHRIPLGLQLAARLLDTADLSGAYIKKHLIDADRRAARLLTDPLTSLEEEGPAHDVTEMADALGAEKCAKRFVAVIPESATLDPQAWVMDAVIPWQTAGLYLGLCLGFRIAAGFSATQYRDHSERGRALSDS